MKPMTVRSNNGLIHGVFSLGREIMSVCGVFYEREKQVPSQAITCLWCANNRRGHLVETEP